MLNLNYRGLVLRKLSKMAQMCPKLHSVPVYRGILEQIFFSVIKKILWHSWHRLKLSYYRWYSLLIGVPRVLAQHGTVFYSARATFFIFLKTFLPKISTIQYISCLLYTSPSPRDVEESRMPSSA